MTRATSYLADLQRALRDLPAPLGDEILVGVREELRGLDDAAAAERIDQLGDPAAIAAAARAEASPRREDALWYTVLTTLLVAVGGIIVPIVGLFIGIGLLWNSRTWTRRDKLVGTLTLPVGGLVVVAIAALAGLATMPVEASPLNPLVPSAFSLSHIGVVIAGIVLPIASAAYLLIRARRLRGVAS